MAQKPSQDTSATLFETSSQSHVTAPRWTAGAVVVLRAMRVAPLWASLLERVRVARGRAGVFVAIDYTLLLVLFALSDAHDLKALFAALGPVAQTCAATWERLRLASRSALSRWLADLRPHHVAALADVVLQDVIVSGFDAEHTGGLLDRDGQRTIVFDDDGTYHGARLRELDDDVARPSARRRADGLTAPGYHGGSRRADATRTRTALQQAHTQEWLGCWSAPGSGRPFAQLEDACAAVTRYLASRALDPAQGLLRLDGLYGYARIAAAITRHGLGYLMRCADYRLLARREVRAVLATPPHARYAAPDSPVVRDVWQVLALPWVAAGDRSQKVTTRLVITRRPAHRPGKPAVGKRVGEWVYELFVTDRSATGWSAEDVLSVYFARGAFEATLAQEDRERDLDRTVSWSPAGQSYWTLIGQLVWNLRLRLGVALAPAPPRVTLWSAAHVDAPAASDAVPPPVDQVPPMPSPVSPVVPSGDAPPTPPSTHGRIAAAAGRATGRFGGDDFAWTADGFLRCPAGVLLRRAETRREPRQLRVIYVASPAVCGACTLAAQCRGRPRSAVRGRRVSVLYPLPPRALPATADAPRGVDTEPAPRGPLSAPAAPTTVPPGTRLGSRAVWWVDLAACRARRALREQLDGQRVVLETVPLVVISEVPFRTRDERAHRRQTWQQRFERNQRPRGGTLVRVDGVPASLDELLSTTRVILHAA